jgi:hypothetical protein
LQTKEQRLEKVCGILSASTRTAVLRSTSPAFCKNLTTGHLQALFSSIFYLQGALRHPVLVAPIGYAFIDSDRTYRPSFVYPYIPGKTLSEMLNGTIQLIFHQYSSLSLVSCAPCSFSILYTVSTAI